MKRIMIIGCSGSGKSTFSRKLNSITNIPVIHLDQYYWKENWVESESEEWTKVIIDLVEKPAWIMDGNYGQTMDIRINEADTIIYLDKPTYQNLWRVIFRTFKSWRKTRPDMPKGCKERFDLKFLHYILTFNMIRRKKLTQKLAQVSHEKRVIIIKSDRESALFFDQLS